MGGKHSKTGNVRIR